MDIDFSIDIEQSAAAVSADLERSIEDATAQIVRSIADDAPDEMRALMVEGGKSTAGSPPRKRSGTLGRSLSAKVLEPNSIEISMVGYGGYLDPLFKEQDFQGAGWANRPFIEQGITRALAKNI